MPGEWIVVEVASLPWATKLFRCHWSARFELVAPDGAEEGVCQQGVRDLALSLTQDELAACPYHGADWRTAAELAVDLVESGDLSLDAVRRVAEVNSLDRETAFALYSFFSEPIYVAGDVLGNGQHRVCALKLARVERCPIEP